MKEPPVAMAALGELTMAKPPAQQRLAVSAGDEAQKALASFPGEACERRRT